MKKKIVLFRSGFKGLTAVFEGEDKSQLKTLMKKFGIADDVIAKLEKGEIKAEALETLFTDSMAAIEKTVDARIREKVIKDEKTQISKGIYKRNEEAAIAVFKPYGFDEAVDLKDVEEKGRYAKILEIGQAKLKAQLDEAKKNATNADAPKVAQLTEQLAAAALSIETLNGKVTEIEAAKTKEVQDVRDEFVISEHLNKKIQSYEANKLRQSPSNIRDLLKLQMQAEGHQFAIERDGDKVKSVSIVNKEGAGIGITGTAKNHDLDSYFEEVGTKREFFTKSNATDGDKTKIKVGDEELKQMEDTLPPEVIAELARLQAE